MERTASAIQLRRRFFTAPVEMHRHIALDDDVVSIRETIRMDGPSPLGVMWGQHPTFGSDLLAEDFVIETGAGRVPVNASDAPASPLVPGGTAPWPHVAGKEGSYDLSRPAGPVAIMACLTNLAAPWAAIRRLDGTVAALNVWNDLLIAIIFLQDDAKRTLMAGISVFQGRYNNQILLTMAGMVIASAPMLIL